jgi:cell division protein FtsQ
MRGAVRALPRPVVALPSLSPRLLRRLLVLLAAVAVLAAGYQFWVRDSSLVAVDDVTITGLSTDDAERVRTALSSAARSMTTLHVDHDALDQVVAAYPELRELRVTPDFPHGLTIEVIEHRPAALADLGDERVPVAGDGTVLRGLPVEGRLPSIDAEGGLEGERLAGAAALHAARVAGAAPAPLRRRVEAISTRADDGLVVELRDGPELIFGDATRARAKWLAAARVLADPSAAGATYVDVRLPGRPAAGGLPAETVAPVAPAGAIPATPGATAIGVPPADPATGTAGAPETQALAVPPTTPTTPLPTTQAPATPAPVPPVEPAPTTPAPAPTDGTGAGAVVAP